MLVLSLLPLLLLVIAISYLYKEKYFNCISKDFSLCVNSKKYTSAGDKFIFRYPEDYPLTLRTGSDLVNQYHFDDKYVEWVNLSTEFYPNAGGDRLGSVIVKNTTFKDVKEYVDKELGNLEVPPNIEYVKIDGKDAICTSLKQQPHSFNPPSYDCFIINEGLLYIISFDYNDYYHKLPVEYYEKARELILSTFSFN